MDSQHPLLTHPLIPVVVIEEADHAVPLGKALLKGGISVVEVTFRTDAAAEAIYHLRQQLPELLVGAGTVVTRQQATDAIQAGSQFGLAPGTDPATIGKFDKAGIPFIPGVMTPSDIQTAVAAGCQYLKFFPASAAGGPPMLKAMAAPYHSLGVRFCPTGGVKTTNMAEYLTLPEVFAVGGTWIATPADIAEGAWGKISEKAQAALTCARQVLQCARQAP